MSVWQEIVDYTVPTSTKEVDLTGFNITKNDFIRIVVSGRDGANNSNYFRIYINNDKTATNYWSQYLFSSGTSISASRENVPRLVSNGNNEYGFANAYLKLSEDGHANIFSNNTSRITSEISTNFFYVTSTNTFTDINTITISSFRNGGLGSNSRIQIYKLAAEKVADVTVNSNTTQVDITGLDIKKGDEYLLVSDIVNPLSNFPFYSLFINDDTTDSNYYSQRIRGNDATADAIRVNQSFLASTPNNSRTLVYSHIKLSNIGAYTSQNYSIQSYGTSSIVLQNVFISSTAENITNINKFNIGTNRSNAIGAVSRFELYKLYEGGN